MSFGSTLLFLLPLPFFFFCPLVESITNNLDVKASSPFLDAYSRNFLEYILNMTYSSVMESLPPLRTHKALIERRERG